MDATPNNSPPRLQAALLREPTTHQRHSRLPPTRRLTAVAVPNMPLTHIPPQQHAVAATPNNHHHSGSTHRGVALDGTTCSNSSHGSPMGSEDGWLGSTSSPIFQRTFTSPFLPRQIPTRQTQTTSSNNNNNNNKLDDVLMMYMALPATTAPTPKEEFSTDSLTPLPMTFKWPSNTQLPRGWSPMHRRSTSSSVDGGGTTAVLHAQPSTNTQVTSSELTGMNDTHDDLVATGRTHACIDTYNHDECHDDDDDNDENRHDHSCLSMPFACDDDRHDDHHDVSQLGHDPFVDDVDAPHPTTTTSSSSSAQITTARSLLRPESSSRDVDISLRQRLRLYQLRQASSSPTTSCAAAAAGSTTTSSCSSNNNNRSRPCTLHIVEDLLELENNNSSTNTPQSPNNFSPRTYSAESLTSRQHLLPLRGPPSSSFVDGVLSREASGCATPPQPMLMRFERGTCTNMAVSSVHDGSELSLTTGQRHPMWMPTSPAWLASFESFSRMELLLAKEREALGESNASSDATEQQLSHARRARAAALQEMQEQGLAVFGAGNTNNNNNNAATMAQLSPSLSLAAGGVRHSANNTSRTSSQMKRHMQQSPRGGGGMMMLSTALVGRLAASTPSTNTPTTNATAELCGEAATSCSSPMGRDGAASRRLRDHPLNTDHHVHHTMAASMDGVQLRLSSAGSHNRRRASMSSANNINVIINGASVSPSHRGRFASPISATTTVPLASAMPLPRAAATTTTTTTPLERGGGGGGWSAYSLISARTHSGGDSAAEFLLGDG